jgi:single-stranded-DNA-specific exonuclease
MLPITHWRIHEPSEEIRSRLVEELGIHPVIAQILINRQIRNPEEARRYLYPSLKDLHNPFLMKDMQKGVDRVIRSIDQGEKVAVFGDYDIDGITSVAILYRFLSQIHEGTVHYIPDRVDEGYGLNREAIDQLAREGVRLIITVDCGTSDFDEVAYARSLGIDTVVLDHHEIPDEIPHAVAVVNPNRKDCPFPFKQLAGVGIVFNFLIALRGRLRNAGFWNERPYPNLREYLDLVALGTIGDIVPLVDENRILTKIGLDLINENQRVGIKALRESAGLGSSVIDAGVASFSLIPRINAAGRIGSPREAVKLLLTWDAAEASQIAAQLESYNRERQRMEKVILDDIFARIDPAKDLPGRGAVVLSSTDWHPGVIGIVASRIVDRFYRPTILISLRNGIGKGSGRSISEFNLYRGLKQCESLLLSFGGHRYAAGISIREENIEKFTALLNGIIREELPVAGLTPQTVIDAFCSLNEVTYDFLSQLEGLAPFGHMNPEPVICVRNVQISSPSIVGNKHLRMRVLGNGVSCNSIWFNKGHVIDALSGSSMDIAFTPQINYWNGASSIQLKMKDMATAATA